MFQIYVQADSPFRLRPEDMRALTVRNQQGDMVPLGTLVTITPTVGPSLISLYNLYPAATIIGLQAPGFSSGEAIAIMEQIARRTLPPGMGYEWTAMSYQEKLVANQMYVVFALGAALGLSGARRPVRELAGAALGAACRAARAYRPGRSCSRAPASTTISTSRSALSC